MSRPLNTLLASAAQRLGELAAERPDVAAVVAPLGELIAFVAADADDHIANALAAAEGMRALLKRATRVMPPDTLDAIHAALLWQPSLPGDFRRERIDAHLTTLRRALIAVHAWLETPAARDHGALLDDLWAFLRADAVRSSRLVRSLW